MGLRRGHEEGRRPTSTAGPASSSTSATPSPTPTPTASGRSPAKARREADKAALQWMHAGAGDDTDGWHLARFDHPDGGRSLHRLRRHPHRRDAGRRQEQDAAAGQDLLETYKPQAVVLMLGTNDASAGRAVADYKADMDKAVDLILGRGTVCILSTIPPHAGKPDLAKSYNDELRKLAKDRGLPLIDFEQEILTRRPGRLERHAAGQERRAPDGRPGRRDGPLRPDGREPAQQRLPAARLAVGRENRGGQKDGIRRRPGRPNAEPGETPAVPPPAGDAVKVAGDARHVVLQRRRRGRRQQRRRRQAQAQIEPGNVADRRRPGRAQGPRHPGRDAAPAPGRRSGPAPRHGRHVRRRLGRGHVLQLRPAKGQFVATTAGSTPTCPGPCRAATCAA